MLSTSAPTFHPPALPSVPHSRYTLALPFPTTTRRCAVRLEERDAPRRWGRHRCLPAHVTGAARR
ncbi:MAG: hypothetical protein AVDCRST_MAG77-71 [uncultured Chloroflexi bacterium]|uniref:Uncharacterized protein n=1 Tax=uncultured Chloroflexota bacterium TaxID=166587 RepID=A0A6J4H5V4_9CHLR|nr:MAG: hypothetical protein AVDCRST_MAG77-71 [uncultured Chloroflexota bacterium]